MGSKSSRTVMLLCMLLAVLGCGLAEIVAAHTTQDLHTILHTSTDRILLEGDNNSESALTVRTERVDPLNDLKKYKGGYNITNKHYWSSIIFTGKFGYIIAALWIVVGIVFAGILLITTICCNKQRRRDNRKFPFSERYWPILLGILLIFLAIIASGVALGGSTRFHSRARTIKNIIVKTAQEASGTIYNVTGAIETLQNNTLLSYDYLISSTLTSTTQKLSDEADNIQRKAEHTMHILNKGLNILNMVTIVTVSLNLMAILALLAFGRILRIHKVLYLLLILCWLLTFLFWAYFGLYFFLDKFAGDTCIALEEYREDPQNSTLSSILPCNDQSSAQTVLHDVGGGIHDIIDQVNANISTLQSLSVPGLEYVCNPFSGPPEYKYQPENCSSNTMQIGDIPQVLKRYTCSDNEGESCNQGEFISVNDYNTVLVYTSSLQSILNDYPGMESLVDCQLVKNAFSEILFKECHPLKRYVHMTWAAFAVLSTIMVLLLVIWTVEAYHDRDHHSPDVSVKPHSLSTETSDFDSTETGTMQREHKLEP